MSFYQHILFTTDLSQASQSLSTKVVKLANFFQAKLSIIHVVEPLPAFSYPGLVDWEAQTIKQANDMVNQLVNNIDYTLTEKRIEIGSIKGQAIDTAKDISADLIIVGSHERHGIEKLLGSNASAIVHGAKCDVLVLHYDNE